MNILFVCNMNQHRSKTAEDMLKHTHNVKSAGIFENATKRMDQTLADWADVIFVFEKKQKSFIESRFRVKRIEIIDIPDIYDYGVDELKEKIRDELKRFKIRA